MTPSMAQIEHWLSPQINRNNRRMKSMDYFVHVIDTGQWRFTGEPIQFSGWLADGTATLLNGQNRLAAMARTRKPQQILVIEGIDSAVMPFLDTGSPRSLADNLHIAGELNASTLASITRLHYVLSDPDLRRTQLTGGGKVKITHADSMGWFNAHREEIVESQSYGRGLKDAFGMSMAAAAVAWMLIRARTAESVDDVNEFFTRLKAEGPTGISPTGGQDRVLPSEALRRWLTRNVKEAKGRTAKPRNPVQTAYLIKGWNAEQRGDLVTHLRWRMVGNQAEDFPEPL